MDPHPDRCGPKDAKWGLVRNGALSLVRPPVRSLLWPYVHLIRTHFSWSLPHLDFADEPEPQSLRCFSQEKGASRSAPIGLHAS